MKSRKHSVTCALVAATGFLVAATLPGCDSRETSHPVSNDPLQTLTAEERAGIRARITRIRAEAQRRADELYNPYTSRDSKIQNEKYAIELREAGEAELRAEYSLSEKDVERLVREYLLRQGVNVSDP